MQSHTFLCSCHSRTFVLWLWVRHIKFPPKWHRESMKWYIHAHSGKLALPSMKSSPSHWQDVAQFALDRAEQTMVWWEGCSDGWGTCWTLWASLVLARAMRGGSTSAYLPTLYSWDLLPWESESSFSQVPSLHTESWNLVLFPIFLWKSSCWGSTVLFSTGSASGQGCWQIK